MGADAGHLVVEALALAVEFAFHAEGGELIGDHTQGPAGLIWSAAGAVGEYFRGCFRFVPRAERAETSALRFHMLTREIGRTLGSVGCDNYPAPGYRIFAQFRQKFKASLESTKH